jgi:DNA-binding response OmpR family regulator
MGYDFTFQVIPISEAVDATAPMDQDHKPVVLIVDDEPLIADSLAVILSNAGFCVLRAYNGAAALDLAIASAPHLLLTDVAMPGMNGVDLAMAVSDALPETKVLLFSAHASSLDLTEARGAGFDFPLLAKPMHPREMLKQISACLYGDSGSSRIRNADPRQSSIPLFWQPSPAS